MKRTSAAVAALLVALCIPALPQEASANPAKLPGATLADPRLQNDVLGNIRIFEMLAGGPCHLGRVIDTEVIEAPARRNVDRWVERWTVDRCGKTVQYRVEMTPGKRGGTDFGVSLIPEVGSDAKSGPPESTAAAQAAQAPVETSSKWQKVAEITRATFFVDFSSIKVDGSLREVEEVRELTQQSSTGAWSYLCRNQYDCAQRRYRTLSFDAQTGHMGAGDSIQSVRSTGEWLTDFTDDSPAETLRKAVCERPAPVPQP